jgi:RHS repeat-associated protein
VLTASCYSYSVAGIDTDQRQSVTNVSSSISGCPTTGTATTTYYCYDGLGRLLSADNSSASCPNSSASYRYGYDVNGNLSSKTVSGTTTTYTVNDANQLTNTGFSYDGNGSETASTLLTALSYNKVDQTTSITPSGGSAYSLAYQGIGQAQRITDGTATQTNDLLGLNNETGSPATYFTRDANGTILGERRGTASYYFLFDGLGSVVSVTDASGNVSDTFSYDPYGNITATTGTLYEPIRYAGGYDDTATTSHAGLIKFGQRYYDPTTGRWTQTDPADTSLNLHGWNQYNYAGDDPINNVDPVGMSACSKHGWAPKFACRAAKGIRGEARDFVETVGGAAVVGASIGCVAGAISAVELTPAGMLGVCLVVGAIGAGLGADYGLTVYLEERIGPIQR